MLRRVELKGLVSYGENESVFELGPGKNVIVGENATGKSALLLAIELGFLGSVGGRNLSDIINDDADEGEVNIDFVHPSSGAELRIHRRIRRAKDKESEQASQIEVRFENLATGETIADRPTEIDKALQGLGIERNIFSAIVHIKQGEVDKILKSGSDQRATLDKLLGIADLEQAYHEIGESKPGRYSGLLRELNHMKESLIAQKQAKEQAALDLQGTQDRLHQLQSHVLSLEEDKQKLLRKLSQTKTAWRRLQQVIDRLEQAEGSLRVASTLCQEGEEALRVALSQAESHVSRIHHGLGDISSSPEPNESSGADRIKDALGQQLVETRQKEEALPVLIEERDKLEESHNSTSAAVAIRKKEIRDSQARIQRIVQFLGKQGGAPEIVCELCGSRLSEKHYKAHLFQTQLASRNQRGTSEIGHREIRTDTGAEIRS